jgi:hypothetical protein
MIFATLKNLSVSRIILGSNPISGFSHQGKEADLQMRRFFTTSRIKDLFFQAEKLGINTIIGRTDAFLTRVLFEYWDEGGKLQWFAQTCPEFGDPLNSVNRAYASGAKACYIHGGVMDHLFAKGELDTVKPVIDEIRNRGMLVGVAGHLPEVHAWANQNLDLDFHMCSYYNPIPREKSAEHVSGFSEHYLEEDRQRMMQLIPQITKPVVHYKIFAAGRSEPKQAITFAASQMRRGDMVCIGVFPKDNPDMLAENISMFESVAAFSQSA